MGCKLQSTITVSWCHSKQISPNHLYLPNGILCCVELGLTRILCIICTENWIELNWICTENWMFHDHLIRSAFSYSSITYRRYLRTLIREKEMISEKEIGKEELWKLFCVHGVWLQRWFWEMRLTLHGLNWISFHDSMWILIYIPRLFVNGNYYLWNENRYQWFYL